MKKGKIIKIIVAVVILFVLAGSLMGGSDDKDNSDNKTTTETKKEEEQNVGIGQVLTVKNVDYIVNGVEVTKTIGSEYINTSAQGIFLVIDLSVTNNGKEALSVSDSFFELLNGENKYKSNSGSAIYLGDSNIIFEEINPGVTLTGKIVFDVPENVANDLSTNLQVQTTVWGSSKGIISLNR